MFESNPYARVGVAMIEELHRVVSEETEAAEQAETETPPRRTWRVWLSEVVANWRAHQVPCPDECEMNCI